MGQQAQDDIDHMSGSTAAQRIKNAPPIIGLDNALYSRLSNRLSNNSTSPNIVKVVRQTFDSYDVKSSKLEHTPKVIELEGVMYAKFYSAVKVTTSDVVRVVRGSQDSGSVKAAAEDFDEQVAPAHHSGKAGAKDSINESLQSTSISASPSRPYPRAPFTDNESDSEYTDYQTVSHQRTRKRAISEDEDGSPKKLTRTRTSASTYARKANNSNEASLGASPGLGVGGSRAVLVEAIFEGKKTLPTPRPTVGGKGPLAIKAIFEGVESIPTPRPTVGGKGPLAIKVIFDSIWSPHEAETPVGGSGPLIGTQPTVEEDTSARRGSHAGGGGAAWTKLEFDTLVQLIDAEIKLHKRVLTKAEWDSISDKLNAQFADKIVPIGAILASGSLTSKARPYPQRSERTIRCYATKDDGKHIFYPRYLAILNKYVNNEGLEGDDEEVVADGGRRSDGENDEEN